LIFSGEDGILIKSKDEWTQLQGKIIIKKRPLGIGPFIKLGRGEFFYPSTALWKVSEHEHVESIF